jgi:hypothetical protein
MVNKLIVLFSVIAKGVSIPILPTVIAKDADPIPCLCES